MDPERQALDQQVKAVLALLEAEGQPVTTEGVRSRVGKRMSDVLAAMKRVAGVGTPVLDADTPPQEYPVVVEAARKVETIAAALRDAEGTLAAQESLMQRAEVAAAAALIDGREPGSLVEARQQVLSAAETLRLLELAHGTAKSRAADALAQAQAQQQQAVWREFQRLLQVHVAHLQAATASWEPLREYCAQHQWAFGLQPFSGSMQILATNWVPHAEALLAQEAAEPGGVTLPTFGQPRAY